MRISRRGLGAVICAALSTLLIGAGAVPASAGSGTGRGDVRPGQVTPMYLDGGSFLEIDTAGALWEWSDSSSGFYRTLKGNGWGNSRRITSLGLWQGVCKDFLEVKGDELVEWMDCGSGYQRSHVMWGWSNARLVTGIDNDTFMEIKTDGTLWQWTWNGSAFVGALKGNGWGNTRIISGIGRTSDGCTMFLEVKGDELRRWADCGHGFNVEHVMWGWSNARLMASVSGPTTVENDDVFVEVKTDGSLWRWSGVNATYRGEPAGNGWGNARLLG
ncbi:hypothetical protein [Micromonospora mirobrigensis]|uniref:Tachylectin n=1 Tax=Micromonospora mirobrigensis TaxID=262898 RepID=A0A1C4U1N7_9ACTN|nr:hypothetical protein [Micromonospora mirobrigensis]SCE65611.1 hypothetical protein GA0070564_101160 [Micromonospora mirobrigensis]